MCYDTFLSIVSMQFLNRTLLGILASNGDAVPAIASDNHSGFGGNQDQWLFFFAAILFFWPVGSQHGCSILVWGSLG